jgi:predicted NUDIX family phosphoesterase/deoxycytidine triphosphate deaminase
MFIVDSEYLGLFRNPNNETVFKNLYRLPNRKRQKVSIQDGYELKRGFSYLIPLREKIMLEKDMFVKSSPKSSLGRLFINTRLIADYNPAFNEINSMYCQEKPLQLWLYVQPLAFNVIVYPKISLNQLRFFKGHQSQFSPVQLIEELKENPIIYTLDAKGDKVPAKQIVTDGLTIHLNLSGKRSHGVVGLRARNNPIPIDLSKKNEYDIEDFFEPIINKNKITITRGEYYLLSSKEVLKVPEHLSIELRDYSQVGFLGPLHFAGFIDNGFEGDLVYEIRSDELSRELELMHNMPVSKLDIYRTTKPDKIYGESTNNYKYQIGPKPAKYFKSLDYKHLAHKYKALDNKVLVIDKNIIRDKLRGPRGFIPLNKDVRKRLFPELNYGFYQSRYNCEADELVMQIVGYLVIKNNKGEIFLYKKESAREQYCEDRLFDRSSIGIGAHISEKDFIKDKPKLSIINALKRSLKKKKLRIQSNKSLHELINLQAIIFTNKANVDRFHLGIVCTAKVDDLNIAEKSLAKEWEFTNIQKLNKIKSSKKLETWTELTINNIDKLNFN